MSNATSYPFVVGTMRWGVWGSNLLIGDAAQLLKSSVEMGINTFDLADIYGDYTTEALFGAALKSSGIARHEIHLISKCAIVLSNASKQTVKSYNTSRSHIRASVMRSLEQIGTDYLDTLLIHRPTPLMDLHEIADTLSELHHTGLVKSFGVSNFDTYAFEQLNALVPLSSHQLELSLTQTQALFDHTLLQLRTLKKPVQIWSPLGSYFNDPLNIQNQRIRPVLQNLCTKYQADESQLLIAWVRHQQIDTKVILGSTNIQRISKMIASTQVKLDDTDWYALLEASRGVEVA